MKIPHFFVYLSCVWSLLCTTCLTLLLLYSEPKGMHDIYARWTLLLKDSIHDSRALSFAFNKVKIKIIFLTYIITLIVVQTIHFFVLQQCFGQKHTSNPVEFRKNSCLEFRPSVGCEYCIDSHFCVDTTSI